MENTRRTTRPQDKLAYQVWNALGNTQSQVPRPGCMHWLGEGLRRDDLIDYGQEAWPRATVKNVVLWTVSQTT